VGARGGAVGQVIALRAGRSRGSFQVMPVDFFIDILPTAIWPFGRLSQNDYQEYVLGDKGGRCVGLTIPSPCADCLKNLEPQPSRVRFQMMSLEFFIDILPAAVWSWGRLSQNDYQEYVLEGKDSRCVRLTTLPPLCAECVEV